MVFGSAMKVFSLLFHVKHHLPILTNIADMSLGETPEILEAWASVVGDMSISFSLASLDKDLIDIKSKSSGISLIVYYLHLNFVDFFKIVV